MIYIRMYVYWYKLLYITRFHVVWQKILHLFFMIGCRRGGDIAPREEWRRQRGTGQGSYEDPEPTTTHLGHCGQKVWSRRIKV
jgi:hypothetical protein